MKSNTHLDSIVFQLTPTRTRCDLVIAANGKTEKIASGLLDPFLAHLKAAREQIGKGGYSIVLEPNQGKDASWFTKGTVERFVRFVSTPEILERVYTIESEIIQIEKAISVQANGDAGEHIVEDLPVKTEDSIQGSKPPVGANEETAIVLYQPISDQQKEDGSTMQEKSSKVQLVQVLQTRKTVLQKEQGMAFARAVAASFDVENISALLSFAECFGASRLMDSCKRFVDLWKAKHENGQWVEVETTEAMMCRSHLPSMNASGIMLLSSNEYEQGSEKDGKSCATGEDAKPQADHQGQPNSQYSPGQFPHPIFPPWHMHQANGLPVFQPYPMQGFPYYQNHPGNYPYFQPPYPPLDDSRLHSGQKTRQRRHSMDSRDLSADFDDTQEIDASGRRMQYEVHTDDDDSVSRMPRKRHGKSSRKQSGSGTVVIRNLNYIASANHGSSNGDPESEQDSGTDDEEGTVNFDKTRKIKKSSEEERLSGQSDGHWQAFQNFLLKDADASNSARSNMYEMEEGKVHGRKPMDDQMLRHGQVSNLSNIKYRDSRSDLQFTEEGNRRGAYRRGADIDLYCVINNRQEKLTDVWDSSLDPVIANGIQGSLNNNNVSSSHDTTDESFVILQRSESLDRAASHSRTYMNIDHELPSVLRKAENHTVGMNKQSKYEPYDLNLMPNRFVEDKQNCHDPALDYEMQVLEKGVASLSDKKEVTTDPKERPRKGVKDQKLKSDKRISAGTRRQKPSKLSPLEDARARAERLRAFKADLQKLKKEQEEEQRKRLESLKAERQKRIAARSGTNPAASPLQSHQARKQLPKLSPVSQKGSKFSDTEPGSSSPLQRSTVKSVSGIHIDSKKAKSGRLIDEDSGNRLTRSASSLSVRKDNKKGASPESKATMARIRRLSEPKGAAHCISSGKTRNDEASELKKKAAKANHDKLKSAAFPEVKLRASKRSSFSAQKRPTTEMLQKPSDKKLSTAPENAKLSLGNAKSSFKLNRDDTKISSPSEEDENTVVEKTVLMLQCEKPSLSIPHASEDKTSVQNMQSDVYKPEGKSEHNVGIPSPASPIIVKEVDREPSHGLVKGQFETHLNETGVVYTEKSIPNTANNGTTEKLYQAPYARVSSLEEPCLIQSDYGKAPPTGLEMAPASVEATTTHVPDGQIVKISDVDLRKHEGKESPKGFRRLLKFAKKNSATSEANLESDKASLDGCVADVNAMNGFSSEAFTLKNLLIEEESSTAGTTSKKSSRSFSLLSSFRSKSSDKKLST